MTIIPVCYSPVVTASVKSYSPSAGKPALAVDAWLKAKLPIALMPVAPVTWLDLYLAHEPRYVDGVLAGALPTGFGTRDVAAAQTGVYGMTAPAFAERLGDAHLARV